MIEVVTIATFGDAIKANITKQNLEAEGITVFLTDERTVSIAWYLTIALRWIKLQVPQPQAEDAMSILADMGLINQFTPDDLTEFTPAETPYSEGGDLSTTQVHDDDDVVRLSWADRTVERMFRVAVFGLIFLPLYLYSLWLMIRLLVSPRRVSSNQYWKVAITIILHIPIVTILVTIFL